MNFDGSDASSFFISIKMACPKCFGNMTMDSNQDGFSLLELVSVDGKDSVMLPLSRVWESR